VFLQNEKQNSKPKSDFRKSAFPMQRSGYCSDGIYRSLRPPLILPKNPNLSLVEITIRSEEENDVVFS